MTSGLSGEEKQSLRLLAHEAIAYGLREGRAMPPDRMEQTITLTPTLREHRGAFVTLKIAGGLRGCIGYPQPLVPLYRAVGENACNAAFEDPRFPSLTREEFDRLEIEISVLSPLTPVEDPSRIRVGTHGLVVRQGFASGLLLPQVAVEYEWDEETFLAQTCRKAGLVPNAWRDPETQIFSFTVEYF